MTWAARRRASRKSASRVGVKRAVGTAKLTAPWKFAPLRTAVATAVMPNVNSSREYAKPVALTFWSSFFSRLLDRTVCGVTGANVARARYWVSSCERNSDNTILPAETACRGAFIPTFMVYESAWVLIAEATTSTESRART